MRQVVRIMGAIAIVIGAAGCFHKGEPDLAQQCYDILSQPSAYTAQQVAICQDWRSSIIQGGCENVQDTSSSGLWPCQGR